LGFRIEFTADQVPETERPVGVGKPCGLGGVAIYYLLMFSTYANSFWYFSYRFWGFAPNR
jgi:hypothetical protein